MAIPKTSIPATGVAQERRAARESARKFEAARPPGLLLERMYPASLVVIVLVGAALRFSTLDMRSFWSDEGATVRFVSMGFGEMLSTIISEESTPPLYYVLAWLWAKLFGVGEVGLRTLSALFGTATIAVVYAVGAHVAGRRVGLLAALVAAVSPLLVWHSQDARAYALVMFVSGLSLLFFLRALAAPRMRTVAAWAVASSLLLTSHYFAVFLVGPAAVWLLARHRARRVAFAVGAVGLVGLALLVPASRVPGDAAWIPRTSLVSRIAQIPAQFLVGYQPPWQIAVSAVAVLLALFGLWLLATRGERDEWARLRVPAMIGATALLLPVLVAVVAYDRLITRAVTIAWIPLAVVVTAGFGVRRAGWMGVSAVAAICVLFLAVNVATADDPKFEREDWRGVAAAMEAPASRAIVLSPAGILPMLHYRPASRELKHGAARVNEIVLIGTPPDHREIGERPRPPRPSSVAAPLPGFVQVGRIDEDL
ncbi:MAG TPA: glycosyltransferase family 39 protein, partial [Gaiellaceae bacterium]